jgi:hypothetical protein
MVAVNFLRGDQGILRGRRLIVALLNDTQFQVRTDGLTLPADIRTAKTLFESASGTEQLQIGQHVQVRFRFFDGGPGVPPTVNTDRVRMHQTRLTGTVETASVSPFSTFTVNALPPIFSHLTPPVSSIQVFTSPDTDFENANGLFDLSTGTLVSLRGLLFKGSPPKMLADRVRKR